METRTIETLDQNVIDGQAPPQDEKFLAPTTTDDAFQGQVGARWYSDPLMDGDIQKLPIGPKDQLVCKLREVHFVTGIEKNRNIGECQNSINAPDAPKSKPRPRVNPPGIFSRDIENTMYYTSGESCENAFPKPFFKVGGQTNRKQPEIGMVGQGSALPTQNGNTELGAARGLDFVLNKQPSFIPYIHTARQNFMRSMETNHALQ
jgi:hypothetical protein